MFDQNASVRRCFSLLRSEYPALFVSYDKMHLPFLAAGLLLFPSASAFWILPCSKPVLDARVDPIVSPGKPNSHAHTIMGSNGACTPRETTPTVQPNPT